MNSKVYETESKDVSINCLKCGQQLDDNKNCQVCEEVCSEVVNLPRKIFGYVANGLVLLSLALLMSACFLPLLDASVVMNVTGDKATSSISFFSFFGEILQNISLIQDSNTFFASAFIGIISFVGVGVFFAILTLTTLGIIYELSAISKKEYAGRGIKLLIIATILQISFLALFKGFIGRPMLYAVDLGLFTVVSLFTTGITMLAVFISRFVLDNEAMKTLPRNLCNLLNCWLLIVLIFIAGGTIVQTEIHGLGALNLLFALGITELDGSMSAEYIDAAKNLNSLLVFASVLTVLTILIMTLSSIQLFVSAETVVTGKFSMKKNTRNLIFNAITAVAALAIVITTISMEPFLRKIPLEYSNIFPVFGILAFALMPLGLSIVERIILLRSERNQSI